MMMSVREFRGNGGDRGWMLVRNVYIAQVGDYIRDMVHDVDRGKGAAIEHKVKVAYVVNLTTSVLPRSMTLFGVSKRSNRFLVWGVSIERGGIGAQEYAGIVMFGHW
jgi:hypothetical protein